ncbi:MAG TPA: bacteriocin [bacterium]|nr:bacteriocin [bacterium]
MKRTNRSDERTLQTLTNDELAHVIGGTGDPSKPVGDPGSSNGDLDAVGQNWSGGR